MQHWFLSIHRDQVAKPMQRSAHRLLSEIVEELYSSVGGYRTIG